MDHKTLIVESSKQSILLFRQRKNANSKIRVGIINI